MDISSYIEKEKMTLAVAAHELGVTRQAIDLWVKGKRIPRPAQMMRIAEWSGGKVTPASFYPEGSE